MIVTLKRFVNDETNGTFGVLIYNNTPLCLTLEDPWAGNIPRHSCIPEGEYEVRKYSGTKYKDVWQVYGVPNRSAILIHWGNTEKDTIGCILVGESYAQFSEKYGITNSKNTFSRLKKTLPDAFTLTIKNHF